MDTVCSKCGTVLRPLTDKKRVLIADNGGQVCSRCFWAAKAKKKGKDGYRRVPTNTNTTHKERGR